MVHGQAFLIISRQLPRSIKKGNLEYVSINQLDFSNINLIYKGNNKITELRTI